MKVAHFRLSPSRHFFVAAYPRESSEMVFDAHNRAFAFFGGTCKHGIYDNISTPATKVLHGKERTDIQSSLCTAVQPLFYRTSSLGIPDSVWEKGQVENVQEWMFTPRPWFKDVEELNVWLFEQCIASSKKRKHPADKDRTIWYLLNYKGIN